MNLSYKKKKQFLITFTLCFVLMTAFFAGKNQMQANATAQGINARYRTGDPQLCGVKQRKHQGQLYIYHRSVYGSAV